MIHYRYQSYGFLIIHESGTLKIIDKIKSGTGEQKLEQLKSNNSIVNIVKIENVNQSSWSWDFMENVFRREPIEFSRITLPLIRKWQVWKYRKLVHKDTVPVCECKFNYKK